MRNLLFILIAFGFSLFTIPASSQELPVLLMLKSSEQQDTTGCNFVQELTALVYDEIINNRVKLWDSQRKEIQITAATVIEIENYSGVKFTELETVFIYEIWTNNKKEILTKTIGISFIHRSNTEEEVVFGYVDYKDLNELFLTKRINTNASGIYSATFARYILSKKYIYNIVQFGGKAVTSLNESEDIKKTYIRSFKFNESLIGYYPPDKYINYIIDTFSEGNDLKTQNSKGLIKQIEEYLIRNQEIFFNMGGDRISTHLTKNKNKVTKVEVDEIWRKVNGEIVYEPKSVVIFINDSALNPVTSRNLDEFSFTIDDMDLFTFLKQKQFNLIITKINAQEIKRKDAFLYYKGLKEVEWNQVIQYVINY